MFDQDTIVKCCHCGSEYNHITNIINTTADGEYPHLSYGYRQGAITIELTCEDCKKNTFVVCGEHKGNIYLNTTDQKPEY